MPRTVECPVCDTCHGTIAIYHKGKVWWWEWVEEGKPCEHQPDIEAAAEKECDGWANYWQAGA